MREVARKLATPLLRSMLLGAPNKQDLRKILPPDLEPHFERVAGLFIGELLSEKRGGALACRLCGKALESRRGAFFHLMRSHSDEIAVVLEMILREEVRRLQNF